MLIIPAIDIYDNSIVRLKRGDFDNITYYKNTPLQQAKIFESHGFNRIHIVDLLGSKNGKLTSLESIKKIKQETKLQVEFGGGIRDVKTVSELFDTGIDYVIIGSLPVINKKEFELIIGKFTPDIIIAVLDSMNEMLKISGWIEETKISIYDHIKYCSGLGIKKFLCTDITKDGMLTGTNISLYKKIMDKYPVIDIIASGGVKDIDDIKRLSHIQPYGVVVGKAIYEGKIDLKELAKIAV